MAQENQEPNNINDSIISTRSADSIACNASADSPGFEECGITTKKQKAVARDLKKRELKKDKKKEKKKLKNNLSKDDFYTKSVEFRIWLLEMKDLKYDSLSPGKQKEQFKKFVKKWNSKKLPQKYYRGIDCLWALGSPTVQSSWAMPGDVEVTPGSMREDALEAKYSRDTATSKFATFGKKEAARVLGELQKQRKIASVAKANVEHIYDEPLSYQERVRLYAQRNLALPRTPANLDFDIPPPPSTGRPMSVILPKKFRKNERGALATRSFSMDNLSSPSVDKVTLEAIYSQPYDAVHRDQACEERPERRYENTTVIQARTTEDGYLNMSGSSHASDIAPGGRQLRDQRRTTKTRSQIGTVANSTANQDPEYVSSDNNINKKKRKVHKQNSYISKLESASYVWFEKLKMDKNKKSNASRKLKKQQQQQQQQQQSPVRLTSYQQTPVRLASCQPSFDTIKSIPVDDAPLQVTPGKSSKPTSL